MYFDYAAFGRDAELNGDLFTVDVGGRTPAPREHLVQIP